MSHDAPPARSLLRELLLSPDEPSPAEEPKVKKRRTDPPTINIALGLPPSFLYHHQGHRYFLQPRVPSNLPRPSNANENNLGQEEQDLMNRLREARLHSHPFFDRSRMIPYPAPLHQQPHHRQHLHHRRTVRAHNSPPQPRDDDLPVTEEMIQHHNQKIATQRQQTIELPN